MSRLPFYWVDAFTTRALSGNPCAIVFDADGLSAECMQAITREMNLSETAFVLKSDKADFRTRYFTPEGEIPLAGHPTIATMKALVDSGRIELSGREKTVTLQLEAGVISVSLRPDSLGLRIVMSQLKPQFLRIYGPGEVLSSLGLTQEDLLEGAPLQTVSTGSRFLMVALKDQASLRKARIDIERFQELLKTNDFRSPHFFCVKGISPDAATFARHPGTAASSLEDPFTGSATGCMGAYLWRYQLISQPRFIAEQGHWMGRPGQADVEIVGPPEEIETVRVAGRAVSLIRGEIEA